MNPYDVYLGRGNGVARRTGNQIYRSTIKKHQGAYQCASGNKAKEKVAKEVVQAFTGRGGTFYCKKSMKSKDWIKAPYQKILKTVKQALREREKKDEPLKNSFLRTTENTEETTKGPTSTKKTGFADSIEPDKSGSGLITMGEDTVKAMRWILSSLAEDSETESTTGGEGGEDNSSQSSSHRDKNEVQKGKKRVSVTKSGEDFITSQLSSDVSASSSSSSGESKEAMPPLNTNTKQQARHEQFSQSLLDFEPIKIPEVGHGDRLHRSANQIDHMTPIDIADIKKFIDPLLGQNVSFKLNDDEESEQEITNSQPRRRSCQPFPTEPFYQTFDAQPRRQLYRHSMPAVNVDPLPHMSTQEGQLRKSTTYVSNFDPDKIFPEDDPLLSTTTSAIEPCVLPSPNRANPLVEEGKTCEEENSDIEEYTTPAERLKSITNELTVTSLLFQSNGASNDTKDDSIDETDNFDSHPTQSFRVVKEMMKDQSWKALFAKSNESMQQTCTLNNDDDDSLSPAPAPATRFKNMVDSSMKSVFKSTDSVMLGSYFGKSHETMRGDNDDYDSDSGDSLQAATPVPLKNMKDSSMKSVFKSTGSTTMDQVNLKDSFRSMNLIEGE
jgi:hypothetical protein